MGNGGRMCFVPTQPTGTRQSILEALKREGPLAIAQLAERLGMSGEAVRQQLVQLQREGWIEALHERAAAATADGPPPAIASPRPATTSSPSTTTR